MYIALVYGNVELQKDFIHLGCYFSVNASMVKNMDVVNAIPKDRLLIESDGPYSKVNGKSFHHHYCWKSMNL